MPLYKYAIHLDVSIRQGLLFIEIVFSYSLFVRTYTYTYNWIDQRYYNTTHNSDGATVRYNLLTLR